MRSAGYGFTVGRNVAALGYVPAELEEGAGRVEVFGEIVPGRDCARRPLRPRRRAQSVPSCRVTAAGRIGGLMAWELATFSADLLRAEVAVEGVDVEIVAPGAPVRVTHVLDAVEPRIRPDGRAAFPTEGKAGEGRTNRLDGVVVLSCLDFPGEERPLHEQESIVDLGGPGPRSRLSPKWRPASSSPFPPDGAATRRPTRAAQDARPVAEELARPTLAPSRRRSSASSWARPRNLPAVAALIQLSDLGPLYHQYVYGRRPVRPGSRAVDPAEVLDGAVTCGEYHWAAMRNPTLFFQRNALVRTLYREHGRRCASRASSSCAATSRARRPSSGRRRRRRRGPASSARTASSSRPTRAATRTRTSCSRAGPASRRGSGRRWSSRRRPTPSRPRPILTDWVPEADSIVSTGNVEELVPEWRPERVLGGDTLLDGTPAADAGPDPGAELPRRGEPDGPARSRSEGVVKAVHYLNQFFAGLGGEDKAETPPTRLEGAVGPGRGRWPLEGIEIVATLACGDDYFAEHEEEALAACSDFLGRDRPDVLVAGPAFGSGPLRLRVRDLRGGCGRARASRRWRRCTRRTRASTRRGRPMSSRRRSTSPGCATRCRGSARSPGDRLGRELGRPEDEGYLARGSARNYVAREDGRGAGVELLLAKLAGETRTEVGGGIDRVEPPPAGRRSLRRRSSLS